MRECLIDEKRMVKVEERMERWWRVNKVVDGKDGREGWRGGAGWGGKSSLWMRG